MERLNHPNIAKLVDWFEEEGEIYMVTELIDFGDMFESVIKDANTKES